MDLKLKRITGTPNGVFSQLTGLAPGGSLDLSTIEHAYPDYAGKWIPKLATGTYKCIRGIHQLEDPKKPGELLPPFETFEIMNVPQFQGQNVTGLLFHIGNYNHDSHGCVLVGMGQNDVMVTNSAIAFNDHFMKAQEGCNEFTLVVL